jgi:hypothetical protein
MARSLVIGGLRQRGRELDRQWTRRCDGFGGRADPANTPPARDAAPGQLSETDPPSTPANEPTRDEESADPKD